MVKPERQSELQIKKTHDGSSTLFVPSLNEHYHSIFGARQESEHVYIKKGLEHLSDLYPEKIKFSVCEFGFGTGLNALLAANWAKQMNLFVEFTTIELFPVSLDLIQQLEFSKQPEEQDLFIQLHQLDWERTQQIDSHFSIHKMEGKFQDIQFKKKQFDCVFFDAFAPNKQADPWELEVFKQIRELLTDSGILVTYCARGHVKRSMIEAGLLVEKVQGPPGKREMFRARKNPDFELDQI